MVNEPGDQRVAATHSNTPTQEGRQVRIHAIGRQIDRLHKLACGHNVSHSLPGAPGIGTNPEQLFAAGWSACFERAIGHAAHKRKMTLCELTINAEVDLHLADGEYFLSARASTSACLVSIATSPSPWSGSGTDLPVLESDAR